MTVVYHEAALRQLLQGPTGAVQLYIDRLGTRIAAEAKQLCPFDPGHDFTKSPAHLRDTIMTRRVAAGGERGLEVGSEHPYALAQHEGTPARVINPRPGKQLTFRSGRTGKMIVLPPGRSVFVPASPGVPYLRLAMERVVR